MDSKVDGSVHHEHRLKLAKETKERKKAKKESKILSRHYELVVAGDPERYQRRGGKVVEVIETATAKHRRYICREKDPDKAAWVAKLKKEKLLTVA